MTSSTTVTGETTEEGGTPAAEPDKPTGTDEATGARKPADTDSSAEKRSARRGFAVRHGRRWRDSSISVKTMAVATLSLAAMATIGALGWQVHDKAGALDRLNRQAADSAHAESVASDYATGAAAMDFHDLAAWRARLTRGTTPELSNRLTQASNSMEQIITPLQWTSTAKPLAAKVRSESDGRYTVSCFVNVLTKNRQAPDGIDSTATYQITLDSTHDWVITDISGIDGALGTK
ncbi:hypothetical protein [Nocardia africana]|uniref:Mce-associated membrane protein n=1 Tax=Nocardia africana TaxID=134964 RepID=A0A378WV03_9NOCA|nr:hypothetical protein [Nocardia africana]MCC3313541.1 hypothetical protein [Nocardia africana]SUA45086.1 Uncharacterised protein [Nocardia africana]